MKAYDAVVVGGGFAGVTAARELASRGHRTVLLEARDRLGGKTYTTSFAGRSVEMGGMSIHWFQPHVWAEITRYSLRTKEAEPLDAFVKASDSAVEKLDKAETKDRERRLYEALLDGFDDVFDRPYEPLHHEDKVRTLDQLSLRDRLDQLNLGQEDNEWLTRNLLHMAGRLEDASFTLLLRWFALAGWKYDLWAEAFTRHRFADGTSSLIDAMAADQDVDIQLLSPVADVAHAEDGVTVTTRSGEVLSGKVAVIAVPVNLWTSINFYPALPQAHRDAAAQGMAIPHSSKVWLHVRGNADRVTATWPTGSRITRIRSEMRLPDGQLVVAFSPHPDFDASERGVIEEALAAALPGSELVDVISHDWGHDEFAQGGSPYLRPGQLGTIVTLLQQPNGRLVFASSELANGWCGYIDGAIESGIAAARVAGQAVGNFGR